MIEFKVEGMSCQHCVGAVTRSIHEIDADARVTVNLDSGSVQIESTKPVDALTDAIDDAGYTVVSAKSE